MEVKNLKINASVLEKRANINSSKIIPLGNQNVSQEPEGPESARGPLLDQNKNLQNTQKEVGLAKIFPQDQKSYKQGKKYLKKINNFLSPFNKELKVEIDRDLKIPVFKIIDKTTHKVIRQIPLKESLKLMKALKEILEMEKEKFSQNLPGINFDSTFKEIETGIKELSKEKGLFLRKEV